ncbi:MAG: carbon-nitrogen hydrolase family protein [Candidatus Thermoplasmatota archaeon]
MKTAIISMRPHLTDKEANLKKMQKYIEKEEADLYVFGETTLTGYPCKDELRDLAEPIDGPSIKKMKKIAKEKDAYIIFGMPTKNKEVKGLVRNSAVLIHPNGKVDSYDKWFLPTFGPFEEKIFYDEGEKIEVFDTKFGKIGLIICYDIFFPEITKALTLQGADIIVCISASPNVSQKYFETLIPARAIENTVFMVYVNLVGLQDNLSFWGGSQAYDPLANLLCKAPYYKENISTCEIDLSQIENSRANRPVIRDTRPTIYKDLYTLSRKHRYNEKDEK